MNTRTQPRPLGNVEQRVMDHVWSNGPVTADACRQALASVWPMKESTVRTVLRRLEAKGYVTHTTEGRTYVYRAAERPASVATRAVQHLIDRFWGGSAEALVAGLVDHAVLSPKQLERLTRRISEAKAQPGEKKR
ncbi:MAG TPA: BlaI/MecI/CopY family transcriptional regulator [Vicinamibacterales bacterium]|nr:BlaI/MecI/CopY family transcriptional regulator [Acidobacteriota bacterium]HQX82649.1 BlaI/MecI/CopY family transcriptional regulator [Vicinamibacterales bacterium]